MEKSYIGPQIKWFTTITDPVEFTKIQKEYIPKLLNPMEKPFVIGYPENLVQLSMEKTTNAMNDIILPKSELAILKAEIKENTRKYNQLLKGFNELIDEHTTAMERLGESDSSQIRYDYFEKAGILD